MPPGYGQHLCVRVPRSGPLQSSELSDTQMAWGWLRDRGYGLIGKVWAEKAQRYEELSFSSRTTTYEKPGMVMCAYNPTTQGAETRGSLGSLARQSRLSCDLQANERLCLKRSGQCS